MAVSPLLLLLPALMACGGCGAGTKSTKPVIEEVPIGVAATDAGVHLPDAAVASNSTSAQGACERSTDWAPIFESPSITIHAVWGGHGYRAVNLDLIRVGAAYAVDGRFSAKPSAPRRAFVPAAEFERFLCLMAERKLLGAPTQTEPRVKVRDDYPAGEIVFRFPSSPPVRAYFLDHRRQWILGPWGTPARVLEDEPGARSPARSFQSHPIIDSTLRELLKRVGPSTWTQEPPPAEVDDSTAPPDAFPARPADLSNATSLTLEEKAEGGFFDIRIELVKAGAEVFGTVRFGVGSHWLVDVFAMKVAPASFARWLGVLDELRRAGVRTTKGVDRPLNQKKWNRYADTYLVPAYAVARVPGAWPVRFEWRSDPPIVVIHDDVRDMPAKYAARLHALRAEIMQTLDIKRWEGIANERAIENGWRARD